MPKKLGKGLQRGRPIGTNKQESDVILYRHPNELVGKLALQCAAKEAGNTGLHNTITFILDELVRIKALGHDEYDHLFKTIFNL